MIRNAKLEDAKSISEIYNHYIRESVATFEEVPIEESEMKERLEKVFGYELPWIVDEESGVLAGYAYATKWNLRSAYKYSVEVSVYLNPEYVGSGRGTKLYTELFEILESKGFHVIIAGITLPNPASQALHEKFGLRKIAHFEEVGFKFGKWLDVGYWQRTYPTGPNK